MRTYVVWKARGEGSSCLLIPPENIDRDWELHRGVPRAAGFPPDAVFRMSDDHPRSIGLLDNVMNLADLIVVHARLKGFLEAKALKNLEYLPVSILNHKGRTASRDYFIVHPLVPQDCLDVQKSGVRFNAIIRTDISSVRQLVLDPSRIDPDVRLFRLAHFTLPVLVDKEIADEISMAGFTGVTFVDTSRYGN